MRVSVCELSDNPNDLARDWDALVSHARAEQSELVLLPEMPFTAWFGVSPNYNSVVWQAAVDAHEHWLARLPELGSASVLGTRPVNRDGQRLNEAFSWSEDLGYRAAHHKYFLPNEDGFWEAEWYSRGDGRFVPQQCGAARVGFQVCTELWALDQSRMFGKLSVQIIATPRATPRSTLDKWVVGGRAAAVCAGAYSISSNHVSSASDTLHLGGRGWVVGPDGDVLALTARDRPVVTVDIDLALADEAKRTYPRYVFS